MRLSRNRYWGYPGTIALLKRLAANVHKDTGWPGILVGDIGQPRGGPALSGHASHQIGLDADIWLTPMPDHRLSREEREEMSATMMVREDRLDVDPRAWTPQHWMLLRDAAQEPGVQRIFVNAAIKKALCREAGADRTWLYKVRPWYGHAEHFHVQIACPADSAECKPPAPPLPSDGCGSELDFWFKESTLHPLPSKPKPVLTLAGLPPACKQIVKAP
jgi:penicillin-insensitive murein endopeptidase